MNHMNAQQQVTAVDDPAYDQAVPTRSADVAIRGPQVDQNEAQVVEMAEFPAQFLNRRSRVRLAPGAPNENGGLGGDFSFHVDQRFAQYTTQGISPRRHAPESVG